MTSDAHQVHYGMKVEKFKGHVYLYLVPLMLGLTFR